MGESIMDRVHVWTTILDKCVEKDKVTLTPTDCFELSDLIDDLSMEIEG